MKALVISLIISVAALAVVPALVLAQKPGAGKEDAAPDSIIVKVNGKKITHGQIDVLFYERFFDRIDKLPKDRVDAVKERYQPALIDELIARELFLDRADALKIEAPKDEVEQAYDRFSKRFKDPEDLARHLKKINRTPEAVRGEISTELRIQRLLKMEVLDKIKRPLDDEFEKELKAIYLAHEAKFVSKEKVRARHILFSTRGESLENIAAKKKEAERVRKLLVETGGDGFAEYASKHSDCPSKAEGGNLSEFTKGEMLEEFEAAAFSQKVGEIGEVTKTDFGYHIIQVQSHSAKEKINFNDAKAGMAAEYMAEQQRKAATAYVDGLRSKAKLEWVDESAKPTAPLPGE